MNQPPPVGLLAICHLSLPALESTYNLGEIQAIISDSIKDQILQLVDYAEQIFAESCHFGVLREVEVEKFGGRRL